MQVISEKRSDIKLTDKEKLLINFYQFDLKNSILAEKKRIEIINEKLFSTYLD